MYPPALHSLRSWQEKRGLAILPQGWAVATAGGTFRKEAPLAPVYDDMRTYKSAVTARKITEI